MDQIYLVENQIDDGQQLLDRLRQENVPIRAACWIKPVEEDRWTLCISTPLVEDKGMAGAYRVIYGFLRSLIGSWLTASDIKLVGDNHPITAKLLDLLQRHPGRSPILSKRTLLGGLPIEEVYVYAPPLSLHATKTEQRRLKRPVNQIARPEDVLLTEDEKKVRSQIVSSGVSLEDADKWIRTQRPRQQPASRPPIPAGTVVNSRVAAYWGDKPEDDPNPLLMIEAPDGARGLVLKDDTDPV